MTNPRPGLTYRPDPEVRELIEDFAKRTHRNLSQAITVLVLAAFSGDTSYGPGTEVKDQFQALLDARHNQLIDERHTVQAKGTEYGGDDPQ